MRTHVCHLGYSSVRESQGGRTEDFAYEFRSASLFAMVICIETKRATTNNDGLAAVPSRLAQKQSDSIRDEVRNRVDPQIAAPDVEQRKYDASETGNDHVAPAPNPQVLQSEDGAGNNARDAETASEFSKPLDCVSAKNNFLHDGPAKD